MKLSRRSVGDIECDGDSHVFSGIMVSGLNPCQCGEMVERARIDGGGVSITWERGRGIR